ncbi:MAG: PilZ domain-containing protein [Candidatus Anammoxibacter sp.]
MLKTDKTKNKDIGLIELIGNCGGSYAIELQDYLNTCLDNSACFQLIGLKQASHIDGLCIRVMSNFIERGGEIRLFNIDHQIKWMLEMERKDKVINVYDEADTDKAVTMFTKEISDKEDKIKTGLKARRYTRVSANFPAEFNYHPGHNGVLSGRAKVINLSEGGMMVDHVSVISPGNGGVIDSPFSAEQELNDIKFQLDKDIGYITTGGHCVRTIGNNNRLTAGVRFTELDSEHKDKIRDFVSMNHA